MRRRANHPQAPSSDVALMVTVPPGCPAATVMTPVVASMVTLLGATVPFSTENFTPVALLGVVVALMVDPVDGGTDTFEALIETLLTETLAVGCASPSRCTVSPSRCTVSPRADRCGSARNAPLTTALPTERCRL